ncbi:hypothetical protein CGH27_18325 [Vibrio parahaemolyticus]|uniref:hypothetical protein n=1 Tax=Vibrio parahaemolyticus TaxID=670 RepID=UPI001121B42A|nr:hypothetical protein [Vibrio parahaemolyticus]TOP03360.1 hypothetical protein CGH27_18325 [Vibrio parahaemolyticus]TOP10145.1 hypothetical protein CGH26_17250 [Vibrio parahaemolyticus]
MKTQELKLTPKEKAEAIEHGRNIGFAVANLAYNPEALPPRYTGQFLENMDSEYSDGGGIPAGVMSKDTAKDYDDPFEFFIDEKAHIASNTVKRNGDTLTIHTSFLMEGRTMAKVTCQHLLSKQQTIPHSFYLAVGYKCKDLPFFHPEAIEIFCAATFSLASECFDWVNFTNGERFQFNAKLALTNDLKRENLMQFSTQALLITYTNKAKRHTCKGQKVRMEEFVESAMEVQAQFGRIDNLDAITREFEQRLASKSSRGYKLAAEQLSEAIKTVEKH